MAFDRKPGFHPRVHAAGHVVHIAIAKFREGLRSNVTPMSRLAVHDNVVIELRTDFTMPRFHFTEIDIEIRARDNTGHMFLW